MGRRPLPKWIAPLDTEPLVSVTTWGISSPFELLSLSLGQVTNALLTRSPLGNPPYEYNGSSFDLHVLGTPPAFILSQDQTLRKKFFASNDAFNPRIILELSGLLSITLQLLRFCQLSGLDFTSLTPACQGFFMINLRRLKNRCPYFRHRHVRPSNLLVQVSDAEASRSIVSDLSFLDEIQSCCNSCAWYYTHNSDSVKPSRALQTN